MLSELDRTGYHICAPLYRSNELAAIEQAIHTAGIERAFGVRQFLSRVPGVIPTIFNDQLRALLHGLLPGGARVIRSLYFDKPPSANWNVNWHQDLTIDVTHREDRPGFRNWRRVGDRTTVNPPADLLRQMVTVRIHLDECRAANGALRVVPGSHRRGIIEMKSWRPEEEKITICEVAAGGVLLLKPLTLHASRRTGATGNRRVIHLECHAGGLPGGLTWLESLAIG